jgi:hypothetical protein
VPATHRASPTGRRAPILAGTIPDARSLLASTAADGRKRKGIAMHSIIYLIGLVVVIAFILSLFGLT